LSSTVALGATLDDKNANLMGRQIDLLDGEWYVNDPYPDYAWLREHAPAYWDETNELWGISRYDDIVEIEKRKDVFVNSDKDKGGYRPNIPADPSIIGLDDPLHAERRQLVSRRFTPRAVTRWEDHVRQAVTELVDGALAKGRIDVVDDLAAPLPAKMIGFLLGFPDDAWADLMDWSERTIHLGGGPRYHDEDGIAAAFEFAGACAHLYEDKQAAPADDVMSVWLEAERTGLAHQAFGLDQIISDCLLLLDGGAETTRTVIGRIILDLVDHPDQWQALKDGADLDVAVEEFIRWVTPIVNMCRVATADHEIGGETIRQGQQVVLMYPSANRDPAHFDEPERFDVTRHPNHHLAFGFGTHFCLGASLARLEIKCMFEELLARVDHFARPADGTVVDIPNSFVYGLKHADVEVVPA
jgi:cytochrome P450 family 142 subfamily A polypeptide 1